MESMQLLFCAAGALTGYLLVRIFFAYIVFASFMEDAKHREAVAVAVASSELEQMQMVASVRTKNACHAVPPASRGERVAGGTVGHAMA